MSKRSAFGFLLVALVAGPATASERLGDPTLIQQSVTQEVPRIATEFVTGSAFWSDDDSKLALMRAVSRWLTANYDFPSTSVLPRVVQVARARISEMRYGPLLSSAVRENVSAANGDRHPTVAIYVDSERTIYLPEDFTAGTPAELSILVHEMVHHLQGMAGLRYDCPQAREKPAYLAQQRWLEQFGQDLSSEFEIDPFTVFVHSACFH